MADTQKRASDGNGVSHSHDRNGHSYKSAASGEWSNSFWACCEPMDLCCMACWCPCILFGKTHHRLKDPSMNKYSTCNAYCCGWLALASLGGFQCILQTINRGKMRNKFGIKGTRCGDCLGAWCCPFCGLVQEAKEATIRTEGGTAVQGYRQNPGMSYNLDANGG